MANHSHVVAMAASAMLALVAAPGAVAASGSPEGPLVLFERRVSEYVELHRRVAAELPAPRVTDDAEEIYHAIESLASALQAARPNAMAGDIFVPAAEVAIRARITEALERNEYEAAMLLRERRQSGHHTPAIVNERFPWGVSRMMWPLILWALPPLPPELEYRLVGPDLVLLDVDADLVVDVLSAVLPEPPPPGSRVASVSGAIDELQLAATTTMHRDADPRGCRGGDGVYG